MKTVSNPLWAGQARTASSVRLPYFAGQKEYEQYRDRLRQFSSDSFDRVADIAEASHRAGADHIGLSMAYAKADPKVGDMIREIAQLIHDRGSANSPQTEGKSKAAELLADFRRAIATVLKEKGYPAQGRKLTDAERSRLQTKSRL